VKVRNPFDLRPLLSSDDVVFVLGEFGKEWVPLAFYITSQMAIVLRYLSQKAKEKLIFC